MDVVRGGIVVLDLHCLTGHDTEHVRMILASLLIEHNGIFGQIESAIAEAVFHVYEDVGEIAAADHNTFSLVSALAARVLAHIDLCRFGSGAIELHSAVNRGHGGGIDGSSGRLGL